MTDEDSVAYVVEGVGVTAKQRDAGIAAMAGDFTKMDVQGALARAGVPWKVSDRAADRLLQVERRAGRVSATSNRTWRAKGKS